LNLSLHFQSSPKYRSRYPKQSLFLIISLRNNTFKVFVRIGWSSAMMPVFYQWFIDGPWACPDSSIFQTKSYVMWDTACFELQKSIGFRLSYFSFWLIGRSKLRFFYIYSMTWHYWLSLNLSKVTAIILFRRCKFNFYTVQYYLKPSFLFINVQNLNLT
jgi:hypothetical protein